jgi:hypothetical protein
MPARDTTASEFDAFVNAIRIQEKAHSPDSFFLSADWLGAYVRGWEKEELRELFSAKLGESKPCVYAALAQVNAKSKLGTSYLSVAVNQACLPKLNDINIEQGGFAGILRTDIEPGLVALITHLNQDRDWQELKLNAICSSQTDTILRVAKRFGLQAIQTYESTSYWVRLDILRDSFKGDYVSSRSANTRQQIRRSIKLLESQHGSLAINHPTSVAQAHAWLNELIEMHTKRWNTDTESSGFMKSSFVDFHHSILDSFFDREIVKITKVTAGKTVIGINMYYCFKSGAYFTFGGVNYEIDSKTRPGIVTHVLSVNDFLANGYDIYDFLEGQHRYKESLCTHSTGNNGWALRRKRLDLVLENQFRRIKRRLKSLTSDPKAKVN